MKEPEFDLYHEQYEEGNLLRLKEFIDKAVSEGKTTFDLKWYWGYYNDVTALDLVTE